MTKFKVSLGFTRLPDGGLPPFTANVVTCMTGNARFPDSPVGMAALTGANDYYETKLAQAEGGSKQDTVEKNQAREVLENLLRQVAAYVQSLAGEDLAMLLSSGFNSTSNNRAQIELPAPVVLAVENPMSQQLALRLGPVQTARAYEVRISYGTSGWQGVGVFTQARRIVLGNLTPGTMYDIQARAIGGSTGASGWSDPVSHMAL
jgi:hypothetical protein